MNNETGAVSVPPPIAPEPLLPMLPPVGLKAIVLSPTTVVLFWSDSTLSSSQVITDSRLYTVRYKSQGSPKYKYFNSTNLNCMIDDLRPNTQYEFAVKVVKGRRESTYSMDVLNTTQESGRSPLLFFTPHCKQTTAKKKKNAGGEKIKM